MALSDPKIDDEEMVWPPPHWLGETRGNDPIQAPLAVSAAEYGAAPVAGMAPAPPPLPPPVDEKKPVEKKPAEKKIGKELTAAPDEAPMPHDLMPPIADPWAQAMTPPLAPPGMAPGMLTPPGGPVAMAANQPPGPMPQDPYAQPSAPPIADAVSAAGAPAPPEAGSPAGASSPDYRQPEDPYAIQPSGYTRDEQDLADYYTRHPDKRVEAAFTFEHARQMKAAAMQAEVAKRDAEQAMADHQAMLAAFAKAQRDSDATVADAQRLANTPITKPEMNAGNLIGIIISGAMGGAMGTGRNTAMEQFNHEVEQSIETQKANLANQWKGLDTRRGAIAEEYARHGDEDRAATAYRLAQYQRGIAQIDTATQQFDPRGQVALGLSGARQQFVAQQQQAIQAMQAQRVKDYKTYYDVEKTKAETDKLLAETTKLRGGMGGGTGGATNSAYSVPIGIDNPFTGEHIMGKRLLAEPGKEKGQWAAVNQQINSYTEAQRAWSDLERIGAQIDYHKNVLGNWDATQATDVAEYDAATHKLVVYLTKALGDKLTQGQLEEQGKRIPALTKMLDQRDVGKMIKDSKAEASRDFNDFMTQNGVDATGIIKAAHQQGAPPPEPKPEDSYEAAREALSDPNTSATEKKSAQKTMDLAEERLRKQEAERVGARKDIQEATKLERPQHEIDPETVAPYGKDAHLQATIVNRAGNEYDQLLKKYRELAVQPVGKGTKGAGDIAAAAKVHDEAVAKAAREALSAHRQYEDERNKLTKIVGGRPEDFLVHPEKYPEAANPPPRGMGDVPKDVPEEIGD